MPDGGEVGKGAAHADERVRPRAPVEPRELGRDRAESLPESLLRDCAVQTEALGESRGSDIDAEPLVGPTGSTERELGAPAARVEDDEGSLADVELRRRGD